MFYYLLTLNIVFYKRNKETQFNYHQFLKYTIYSCKIFKIFNNRYIILKNIKNIWEVLGPCSYDVLSLFLF